MTTRQISRCKKNPRTTNHKLFYGKTCTTTIEFLDNENCQQIDKRAGMKYGAGTYYMKADSVIFTVDGSPTRGKVTDSTIVTTMISIR